ncbi:MAG: gluconate 2-dehydrogenase subunit 3 family protein [Natrialbaceae archaeon]|nr:gluconate 2-dehydrogenase subunit 3 family protein [Natrialbaceae archaeon]
MDLTRRDATVALAVLGAGGAGVAATQFAAEETPDSLLSPEETVEAMTAVASVVFPSAVSGIPAFVEQYLEGRLEGDHGRRIRETVSLLDGYAVAWHDASIADLPLERVDTLLEEAGTATASEDPQGTAAERIRYYVVNELLLGLYSSPTGGVLVGLENPQGHAGGLASYQRGPQ